MAPRGTRAERLEHGCPGAARARCRAVRDLARRLHGAMLRGAITYHSVGPRRRDRLAQLDARPSARTASGRGERERIAAARQLRAGWPELPTLPDASGRCCDAAMNA